MPTASRNPSADGGLETDSPLVYLSTHFIRAKEYLEAIVASTSDAICTTDMRGRIIYFSPGAERMLGLAAREVAGRPAHALYEGGREEAERIMRALLQRGRISDYETVLAAGGRRVPVSMSASLLRDKDGRLLGTLGISKDITRRVELERRLRELSITDELTGLYNQRHFHERASAEMRRARRQRQRLSLVLLDLDGFRAVNDSLGHLEGDRILRRAAAALQRSIRDGVDAAFRCGGDEFLALLPGLGTRNAARVARRIQEAFESGAQAGVTLSFGVASLRLQDALKDLLRRADARMYRAKRSKKRC